MKKIIITNIITFILLGANAQTNVGIGTTSPNANAILDITSTNKGLLLPRLALSATANATPLSSHVAGMTVYNTATANDVTPGYYYNTGTKWVRLADASNYWSINGNEGTDPDVNFIGTTDSKDLIIKRGGLTAGYLTGTSGLYNNSISLGIGAMPRANLGTSYMNNAFGYLALSSLQNGRWNNAFGYSSLMLLNSGVYNTGLGHNAMQILSSGSMNTAVGSNSMVYTTTGNWNVAIGGALGNLRSGDGNVGVGVSALSGTASHMQGSNYNVGVGFEAGNAYFEYGNYNIAIGANTVFPQPIGNYQLTIGNSIYGLNINDGNNANDLIGIQTIAPTNTLDVNGTARVRSMAASTSANDKILVSDPDGVLKVKTASQLIVDAGVVKGRVACSGASTQIITNLNIQSNSVVLLAYEDPTGSGIISCQLGTRTVGTGFEVHFGSVPPTTSFINYAIIN